MSILYSVGGRGMRNSMRRRKRDRGHMHGGDNKRHGGRLSHLREEVIVRVDRAVRNFTLIRSIFRLHVFICVSNI